jgi:proteasome lid subunit RPN8/RPN11
LEPRFRLLVPRGLLEEMVQQALAELPNECCGFLAGRVEETAGRRTGRVERRYPLTNAAASPREYEADPRALCAAHRDLRQAGLEVLAIYHSHPTTAPVPSRTDLARNFWPDAMALIISLQDPELVLRAWWLAAEDYQEAEWEIKGRDEG